jgi:hypothetical protein
MGGWSSECQGSMNSIQPHEECHTPCIEEQTSGRVSWESGSRREDVKTACSPLDLRWSGSGADAQFQHLRGGGPP